VIRWLPRAAGLLLLAAAFPPASAAEAEAPEAKGGMPPEASVCLGCHTVDEAGRRGAKAAPPLWQVVGRTASVEGLADQVWTPEALNRWLANPRAMAPQTRSRFPGVADAETRDRMVRFLQGLE
jgi:cytochrome c